VHTRRCHVNLTDAYPKRLTASYHGRIPGAALLTVVRSVTRAYPERAFLRQAQSITAAHPEELKVKPSGHRSPSNSSGKAPKDAERSPKAPEIRGEKRRKRKETKEKEEKNPRCASVTAAHPEAFLGCRAVGIRVCVPRRTSRLQRGSYTPLPPRCQPASALEDPRRTAAGASPDGGRQQGGAWQAPCPDCHRAAASAGSESRQQPSAGLPSIPQCKGEPFGALLRTAARPLP